MEPQDIIRKIIEIGREAGFITFDQLNEIWPKELGPEHIEALMATLSEEDIQLTEGDSPASEPTCSFCGKAQPEVLQLIAGPQVFICNECVQLCVQIISTEHPEWLPEHQKFVGDLAKKSI